MKIKTLQIHKRSVNGFSDIQDKYYYNREKGVFAISDGATQGFKSEIWAEILVNNFVQHPEFEVEKLLIDLEKYAQDFSEIKFEPNPNSALRMLELRKIADGSYATFIGIEVGKDTLKYISSGDVCGFVKTIDGLQSFPFSNVEELDRDKGFLSTTRLLNHQVKPEQFRSGKLSIKENDKIILMTDAVARLTLRDNNIIDKILHLEDFESFKDYIISEWEAKRLEEDDITICVIEPNAKSEEQNIYPPRDFTFPKVETLSKILNPNLNKDGDMEKIIYYLKPLQEKIIKIDKDIQVIKKILLSGIIFIIILFIGLFIFFCKYLDKVEKEAEKYFLRQENIQKSMNTELEHFNKELIIIKEDISSLRDSLKSNKNDSIKMNINNQNK